MKCCFQMIFTPAIAFVLLCSLASGQERGSKLMVTATPASVAETVADGKPVEIPFGEVLRVGEVVPNRYQVWFRGQQVYINNQDAMPPADALVFADNLIAKSATAEVLGFKAHVLFAMRRYGEAIATAEQCLTIDPHHLTALYYRAHSHLALEEYEVVEQQLLLLQKLAPDHPKTQATVFRIEMQNGQSEAAIAALDKLIEVEPWSHVAWQNKGLILVDSGNETEALQCYRKSIQLEPNAWGGYCLLGYSEYYASDEKAGRDNLEKAYELGCRRWQCLLALADYATRDGDGNRFRQMAAQASLTPGCERRWQYHFAWEMATSGDSDRRDGEAALKIAMLLVESGETEPELVAKHLRCKAAAEAESGQFVEALTTLNLVNPDSRDPIWKKMKDRFDSDEPYRRSDTFDM